MQRRRFLDNNKRRWLFIGIALLLLYLVVPQLGFFRHGRIDLASIHYGWMVAAFGFNSLTFVFAAVSIVVLAAHRLPLSRTIVVQVASTFVGRLLPAGLGGLGVNYAYLLKRRHTVSEGAAVLTVNNVVGLLANLLLVGIMVGLFHHRLPPFSVHLSPKLVAVWPVIVLLAILIVVSLFMHFGPTLKRAGLSYLRQLQTFGHRWRAIGSSWLSATALTTCNVLALYCVVLATGQHLPFTALLIIYGFGVLLGTLIPTPGGVGGVEAGLVAGLVSFGVTSGTALSIALLYRVVNFWLPLGVGLVAFIYSERRQYYLGV